MIQIHQNRSLKKNTTFRLDIVSPLFTEPKNISELTFALEYAGDRSLDHLVIGEGSNLLFTGPFDGLIIHPVMQGIEMVDESSSEVLVKVGAGVNWDTFVEYCVQQKWYGTENLSLIPGSVGAAPVQNIGAYGAEVKDIVEYVEVLNTSEMKPEMLSNAACEFGYRDSVFKHGVKDRYIVTGVVFRLAKRGELVLDYGNVQEELMKRKEQSRKGLKELTKESKEPTKGSKELTKEHKELMKGHKELTERRKELTERRKELTKEPEEFLKGPEQDLQVLRDTIIAIRQSKLPDPEQTGNAGSFFKNPVIARELFFDLEKNYRMVPNYPVGPVGQGGADKIKVPGAWLIEKAGWKGVREGDVGTWPLQPLVIVNYGSATGKEIYDFSEKIRRSIAEKFNIELEREVTVIGG